MTADPPPIPDANDLTAQSAIDDLQNARDILWGIERDWESEGLATDEITSIVLALDKLLVGEQERWRAKKKPKEKPHD